MNSRINSWIYKLYIYWQLRYAGRKNILATPIITVTTISTAEYVHAWQSYLEEPQFDNVVYFFKSLMISYESDILILTSVNLFPYHGE